MGRFWIIWIIWAGQYNHKGSYKNEAGASKLEKEMRGWKQTSEQCRCKQRDTEAFGSWKTQEMNSPPEPSERISSADNLILFQRDPFQNSDLQNYKIINACCLKLLSYW